MGIVHARQNRPRLALLCTIFALSLDSELCAAPADPVDRIARSDGEVFGGLGNNENSGTARGISPLILPGVAGKLRYRHDHSEETWCPANWPSESGRFTDPYPEDIHGKHHVVSCPPLAPRTRYLLTGYPHSGGISDTKTSVINLPRTGTFQTSLSIADPDSVLAPNAHPTFSLNTTFWGNRTVQVQDGRTDTIDDFQGNCCMPTLDCWLLTTWHIDSKYNLNGRRFASDEQQRLSWKKRKCCMLQYEMSCEKPRQFRGLRDFYMWRVPPTCSNQEGWFWLQLHWKPGMAQPPDDPNRPA